MKVLAFIAMVLVLSYSVVNLMKVDRVTFQTGIDAYIKARQ